MHSLDLEVKSSEVDQWVSNFWAQDSFAILKIIENLKKLLFMWVISTNIYNIRNSRLRNLKNIYISIH